MTEDEKKHTPESVAAKVAKALLKVAPANKNTKRRRSKRVIKDDEP